MVKRHKTDQHLVQAYQSPYTNELFSLNRKGAFEKHLRAEEKIASDRLKAAEHRQTRLRVLATIRHTATCMEDVVQALKNLPSDLGDYYRKDARCVPNQKDRYAWAFTLAGNMVLKAQSITHECPLGETTNWGGLDEKRSTSVVGLSGQVKENLNYLFSEAKRESGIAVSNSQFVLFAADWPFVAKMALTEAFNKTIHVPNTPRKSSSASTSNETNRKRLWADINAYSMAYVGMPYNDLSDLRDTLGLTIDNLNDMMKPMHKPKTVLRVQ